MSIFPGIVESLQNVSMGDIVMDLDAQQEEESAASLDDPALFAEDGVDVIAGQALLRKQIAKASNSTTERTQKEYEGLQNAFLAWLKDCTHWVSDTPFFTDSPHPSSPDFIVAWIMSRCDNKDAEGKTIPASQSRQSYSYALKMRAAMTHAFGQNHGLGKAKWHKTDDGKWKGNPSVSDTVSGYLVNLHRAKTRAGEKSVSARAIREDTLQKIYNFSKEQGRTKPLPYSARRGPSENDEWGSPRIRLQTYALMLVSFWCLLRCDEAVRIRHEDLEYIPGVPGDPTTPGSFELTLSWRKTNQFGQVKPFRLWVMGPEHAHVCPVRAIARWIKCADKEKGRLFRKMASGDRVSDEPLTSETFLEWFRNCLVDVGVYPFPYGTHSFRRGGCQFLTIYMRWGPRKVADWGGWSTEFTWVTIVTYLINWSDSAVIERDNFLRPGMKPVMYCSSCGRSCDCGGSY